MEQEYKIKSALVTGVNPKKFTEDGKHHYYVRIYLEASEEALNQVELVKYTLHRTFKDRYRASTNRSTNFDIKIWTYGYFDIKASVLTRDGRTLGADGYVEWEVPPGMTVD